MDDVETPSVLEAAPVINKPTDQEQSLNLVQDDQELVERSPTIQSSVNGQSTHTHPQDDSIETTENLSAQENSNVTVKVDEPTNTDSISPPPSPEHTSETSHLSETQTTPTIGTKLEGINGNSSESSSRDRNSILERAGVKLEREDDDKASDQMSQESNETPTKEEEDITIPSGEEEDITSPAGEEDEQEGRTNHEERRVRFSDNIERIQLPVSPEQQQPSQDQSTQEQTQVPATSPTSPMRNSLPGMPQFTTEQLVTGITYQAQYLGSTPIIFSSTQKTVRMQQAREAVKLIKDPENETQPRIDIELKISTKSLIIADKATQVDLMTHPLKTVSYVADIEGSLVVMAHRTVPSTPNTPVKLTCHVLDTADPREVAMVIGQAFSTAYKEFLRSHGIQEESLDQFEYQHVLNAQSKSEAELNSLKDDNKTKEITFAKHKGDILGLSVIDSGYGSAIPSCIIAHMSKTGAACQSGLVNVGDQIISINGVSLVGLPLKVAIEQIKKCRYQTVVKMVTCCSPAVVDVTIMRPDLKFQLGFTVKEGNICSLWRGSIAERSGIRVGHRIIEINGTSAVGMSHEEIVHMLSTTVGDLHIRTMPIIMYQLLTGQLTPEYF